MRWQCCPDDNLSRVIMDISKATLNLDLNAGVRATQEGTSGALSIGKRIAQTLEADIAYSFTVVAVAAGNVATLTHSTGMVAQTTGFPSIEDGDGKDVEGSPLLVSTGEAVLAVLLVAPDSNAGTVAVVGADLTESPSGTLRPGGFLLLGQPGATAVGSGSTMGMTFSTAYDRVHVFVLARAVA